MRRLMETKWLFAALLTVIVLIASVAFSSSGAIELPDGKVVPSDLEGVNYVQVQRALDQYHENVDGIWIKYLFQAVFGVFIFLVVLFSPLQDMMTKGIGKAFSDYSLLLILVLIAFYVISIPFDLMWVDDDMSRIILTTGVISEEDLNARRINEDGSGQFEVYYLREDLLLFTKNTKVFLSPDDLTYELVRRRLVEEGKSPVAIYSTQKEAYESGAMKLWDYYEADFRSKLDQAYDSYSEFEGAVRGKPSLLTSNLFGFDATNPLNKLRVYAWDIKHEVGEYLSQGKVLILDPWLEYLIHGVV